MGPCTCNHHYCQPSGSSPCLSQAKKTNQSSRFYCNGIRHDSVGPYGFEAKFQLIWPNEMDVARSYFMALPLFRGSLNIPPFPTCIFTIWKILEGVPICGSLPRTYNFVDISVCFWQVFRCLGPRCIIRLLKVLQKVFHRTQRLLQGECFSSTRLFFVRISDLFLLPASHFF